MRSGRALDLLVLFVCVLLALVRQLHGEEAAPAAVCVFSASRAAGTQLRERELPEEFVDFGGTEF